MRTAQGEGRRRSEDGGNPPAENRAGRRAADNTWVWTIRIRTILNKRYCPRGSNFGVDVWTIGQFYTILIPGLIVLMLHAAKRPSLAAQSARPILARAAVGDSHKHD